MEIKVATNGEIIREVFDLGVAKIKATSDRQTFWQLFDFTAPEVKVAFDSQPG